ncbi:hypothetical protein ACFVH0_00035 [Streptomyces sp. NPDC127117]|uniref:hypothetical protein n=1 Tax=Streptomyces sp. NPDC127117 TaxID=3345368 RepID=UPI0036300B36
MTPSLGTLRAWMRSRLTGETHAQARQELHGPDGVPDASHPEQAALEAAVLSELHEAHAYDDGHNPLDDAVYGITRVRPTPVGLTLELADLTWRAAMDVLLPTPELGLDIAGLSIAGVPGLRVRNASKRDKGRFELFCPGHDAVITVQVPRDEASEARAWIDRPDR